MKIVVIGLGNMGLTYAQGMAKSDFLEEKIYVYDKSPEVNKILRSEDEFIVIDNIQNSIKDADIIFLAVKPFHKDDLFDEIKDYVNESQVVVSLMAGVLITTIKKGLGINKIVRTMPNLPAKVGRGTTSFTASKEVTKLEMMLVKKLLNSTGIAMHVESENFIDKSTGISGSGPAYVFYFMQSMMEAATQMGFSVEESKILVTQTFSGAIELFNQHEFTPVEWMNKVASKGGTTRAALDNMESSGVKEKIKDAAFAAFNRAVEMGGE